MFTLDKTLPYDILPCDILPCDILWKYICIQKKLECRYSVYFCGLLLFIHLGSFETIYLEKKSDPVASYLVTHPNKLYILYNK